MSSASLAFVVTLCTLWQVLFVLLYTTVGRYVFFYCVLRGSVVSRNSAGVQTSLLNICFYLSGLPAVLVSIQQPGRRRERQRLRQLAREERHRQRTAESRRVPLRCQQPEEEAEQIRSVKHTLVTSMLQGHSSAENYSSNKDNSSLPVCHLLERCSSEKKNRICYYSLSIDGEIISQKASRERRSHLSFNFVFTKH